MLLFNSFRKSQPARIGVMIGFALLLMVAAAMKEPRPGQAASRQRQSLTFEDRVAAQRAIEEVYHRHRIWPKENPRPKPSLDEVMPEEALRAKVEDYLRMSRALEVYWQRPITGEQLQAEMERMAGQTKQPDVLRELWAALDNDPLVIAECLARPLLAKRLTRNWYASDERFHGELKQRAEAELSRAETVEQMRQTSGEYHELEWRQGDGSISAAAAHRPAAGEAQVLDEEQWREQMSKLAQMFNAAPREAVGSAAQRELTNPQSAIRNPQSQELPVGRLSGLQEDETRFYAMAVIKKGADRLKVGSVEWRKTSFDEWWSSVQGELSADESVSGVEFRLPVIEAVSADCARETWTLTFVGAPDARSGHTAVWTGSEMIVWGGSGNTGGRYNPATDTWTATSITGAPSARDLHTAVWTGSEMIVWGGEDGNRNLLNTGGRYNPATDTWTGTSATGAPSARFEHTAVWTGSEMIVWGGEGSSFNQLNTGGRYNSATDTWTAASVTGAPSARDLHTSVWTGSEMIVWGGGDSNFNYFNTGGRYNPATDTWMATHTAGAPSARSWHTAIWTGSEMIIWGGTAQNTGGRYNPATDIWTATSITGAPSVRNLHTAVWTGSEMIVWGGGANSFVISFNTGGRYNPACPCGNVT